MGPVKSCCIRPIDDKLMVTKMDLSHCGCIEVPHVVFNAERCIETLILASNQISSLPPQLFHCQEMKHLNLNDNCLNSIPPAIGSFSCLVSLKLDKNNLLELPDNLKMCKKLKRISLSNNPWKQVPNVVTQLINLEELYLNDCELSFLPASVGRLSKLKILELRNNNLCNLPLSLTRLELLSRLDISDNDFREFPQCIPKLKNLKELLLDNNDVEEIIDIKNLIHLEHLDASYNHISKVSETIGCCVHLNMLNLSFNYIEQLPVSIGNITHLQTLQLEMNELAQIPNSIGKLSYLEELNLCNNKLCSLPSTIGLLRNLRNINVSRNIIEEFPPEIGSCSKLGIINAAYNRLRVLPSEIGYLNNLKVLDLVGNFLMYLPITIINLRGVRAIWLSANQNVPLIPFTEDLNLASGERFLTNIALPQLGEIPLFDSNLDDKKATSNEKTMWSKKISFAEDEDILPGKLHRTPTPFPKELRAPNRKHQKTEEPKKNDNYVNVIDGKVSDQEAPLLLANSMSNDRSGAVVSDGCGSQIREANIRRNHKDAPPFEENSIKGHDDNSKGLEDIFFPDSNPLKSVLKDRDEKPLERERMNTPVQEEVNHDDLDGQWKPVKDKMDSVECSASNTEQRDSIRPTEEFIPSHSCTPTPENNKDVYNSSNSRAPVIYSNVVNENAGNNETGMGKSISEMNPQRIREMYHNDIIYGSTKSSEFQTVESRRNDFIYGNVANSQKQLPHNNRTFREHSFPQPTLNNFNKDICKPTQDYKLPPTSSHPTAERCEALETPTPPFSHNNNNNTPEQHQPLSKQDFISIAEQMKNRNIPPPCYEIAKMYSTKAALFENNRIDQLKSK